MCFFLCGDFLVYRRADVEISDILKLSLPPRSLGWLLAPNHPVRATEQPPRPIPNPAHRCSEPGRRRTRKDG